MRATVLTILIVWPLLLTVGCSRQEVHGQTASGFSGSVQETMTQYGCRTCHVIPGVPGAVGTVGPSLDAFARRSYLAGRLANNQTNLERWIMHPQLIEPGVAMPEMGVTQKDAHAIATYLEQLQ